MLCLSSNASQKNQIITMAGSVRIKTCDLDLMQEPQVICFLRMQKKKSLLMDHFFSLSLSLCSSFDSTILIFRKHLNNREPSIISTLSYEYKVRRDVLFNAFISPFLLFSHCTKNHPFCKQNNWEWSVIPLLISKAESQKHFYFVFWTRPNLIKKEKRRLRIIKYS